MAARVHMNGNGRRPQPSKQLQPQPQRTTNSQSNTCHAPQHQQYYEPSQTDAYDVDMNDEPHVDDEEEEYQAPAEPELHAGLSEAEQQQLKEEEAQQMEYYQQQSDAVQLRTPQPQIRQVVPMSASPLDTNFSPSREGEEFDLQTVPSTPPLPPVTSQPPKKLLEAGLAAMKKNAIPGFFVVALAFLIIIIYFSSSSAQAAFSQLAEFKASVGYLFSAVSTSLFAGIIPWAIVAIKTECQSGGERDHHNRHDSILSEIIPDSLFFRDLRIFLLIDLRRKALNTQLMTTGLDMHVDHHPDLELAASSQTNSSTTLPVNGEGILLTGTDIPLETLSLDSQTAPSASPSTSSLPDPGKPTVWMEGLFYAIFWFIKGMEVDAFYRLQAIVWGSDSNFGTIFAKVFVDQFIYNPIWGCPSVLGAFLWKDCNFDFKVWWSKFGTRHFFFWCVPECLISLWMIWIPTCTMVYILPGPLQVPLFNIVACFWTLILSLLSSNNSGAK